jgi:two-component system, NtrC family, sensor histidine kinase KinB
MKTTVRNRKFTMGMILFLVIILVLCISSAFYLNELSDKTGKILKENHYSVVYASEMSESLNSIYQEITTSLLTEREPDKNVINEEFRKFRNILELEKKNITEVGEGNLAEDIEKAFSEFIITTGDYFSPLKKQSADFLFLEKQYSRLYQDLVQLAQINEKAIEGKTNDAKATAKSALVQMSFIGAFCFLLAYGFTFSFSSYFNDRFHKLYDGIKEIVSDDYNSRLIIAGNDEVHELSVIFNEMAEKLNAKNQKMAVVLHNELDNEQSSGYTEDLKTLLTQIRKLEDQTNQLIMRKEKS